MKADILPVCRRVRTDADASAVDDFCTLHYGDRRLQSTVLATDGGERISVELNEVTMLREGDALELDDGRQIVVRAAAEALLEVTGDDLLRLAWQFGGRNVMCQIEKDRILVKRDRDTLALIAAFGASTRDVVQPFLPETRSDRLDITPE